MASEFDDLSHFLFSVHAHIYAAVARQGLGRNGSAAEALRRALDLAVPDKVYMPFVENADLLEPLLASPAEKAAPRSGISGILRLAKVWEKHKQRILAKHFSAPALPLTKRELQLARLALAGKKYKGIAQSLGLALATVKKAFAGIYRKLRIHDRDGLRQCLAGREGIIPFSHDAPGGASKCHILRQKAFFPCLWRLFLMGLSQMIYIIWDNPIFFWGNSL